MKIPVAMALTVGTLTVGGCGTMTVDSQVVSSLRTGDAYMELRTVRAAMDVTDSQNDTLQMWGVNRTHEAVCMALSTGLGWDYFLVQPSTTRLLTGLGRSSSGSGQVAVSPDGQTCDSTLFD